MDYDEDEGRWRFESEPLLSSRHGPPPSRYKGYTMVELKGKLIPLHKLPWWRKDKHGWPIETVKGKPIRAFFRILFQNIRKIGI